MENKRVCLGVTVLLILVLLIGVFGCETTPAEKEPVKLGAITYMTGVVSDDGLKTREGMELAVKEINDNGGVLGRPVELLYYDNGFTVEEAVTSTKEAISDGVHALVGFQTEDSGDAGVQLAQKENIPIVVTYGASKASSDPDPSSPNYYVGSFHTNIYPHQWDLAIMKWIEDQGYKSCANLYIDIAYGYSESAIYNERWGQPGSAVKLTAEIFYPFGAVDIGPEIAKLVESDPDVINLGIWGGDAGIVVAKKLNELGWTGPVIVGIGCLNTEFVNALGSLCEGWVAADNWAVDRDDPVNWQFAQNYQEMHGRMPDSWGATGYTGVKALLLAMNEAGTVDDVDAIADAIYKQNWDSPFGEVKFLPGGQLYLDKCYLVQVQEGKVELLATPALSLKDYTSPHDWYGFME